MSLGSLKLCSFIYQTTCKAEKFYNSRNDLGIRRRYFWGFRDDVWWRLGIKCSKVVYNVWLLVVFTVND